MKVPFNRPYTTGREAENIKQAITNKHLSGDGPFTVECERWLKDWFDAPAVLLTHSGTAALELAALLANIGPGDEVIMPSFTFVSTANAFALRGAVPVFADIDPETFNLCPEAAARAITPQTRAIVPVHYAGVACNMASLNALASAHDLCLIEDAAHCLGATLDGRELGSIGAMGALSFHETKNIICGEGGALVVNDASLVERAQNIRQKGTNRRQFLERKTDKYTWVDIGSSFLPSDITAAFLAAQLEEVQSITDKRLAIWRAYHERLAPLESRLGLRRPVLPENCRHNAHIYHILLPAHASREHVLHRLQNAGVYAIFHYVPLHSSPAGLRFGRCSEAMNVTDDIAARIVRLPLWVGMTEDMIEFVVDRLAEALA